MHDIETKIIEMCKHIERTHGLTATEKRIARLALTDGRTVQVTVRLEIEGCRA